MQKNDKGHRKEKKDERSYGYAIRFARMWGVAETLQPLPNRGMREVEEKVTAWAAQYAEEEEEELVRFFVAKMREEFPLEFSLQSGELPFYLE